MSNPQTIKEMERTDSSSKTTKKIVKFSHSWTIEHFCFFLHEDFIESPAFSAEGDPGTRWCLRLYPKGKTVGSKHYISLFLDLLSSQMSEVPAGAVLHLQGSDGQSRERALGEVRIFMPNTSEDPYGWGWEQFMVRDTKERKYLSDDKLTIRCEISYAMETENIVNLDTWNLDNP